MPDYDAGHLELRPVTTRTWVPPLTIAAYYNEELEQEVPEHTYAGFWKEETHYEAPIDAPPLKNGETLRFTFTLVSA